VHGRRALAFTKIHSKSVQFLGSTSGIRIQIYATLIHYVLTHLVILKAMQVTGHKFKDFSIPYCLDAVQQVLQLTGQLVMKGSRPDWDQLEAQLLRAMITKGLRPNRNRKRLITVVKAQLELTVSTLTGGP